ncbi:CDP-diacylglycerol--glycerol-3-phosphate 3-phosphatidyltransferase [Sulfurihydrogenibium azorense Az-Fu1]|uniref:CDP-diacylglycerol--glycerol-3-phosphate 3-phosphatidyltransferase n=1 Tax=Sulfurihydrogenibium azorense (strain DSM 15241 / OCM 825 / Az-Fu1) TaxID=204536 RepID=C1DWM0_SULAA|nr:CDP-alcohol phosphatidyltransferase family protein [Sulfurihydrogenibium azorense]ACN99387.1 CDP-diacylglycerol--glycerol-3-phosphate 3-phosphatidyltransferase [Sulfurihydrogenibium azorense Az-Fu1]
MSQIIKNIKPIWEEKTTPIVDFLYKINVSPNILTVVGLVFVFVGSFFIIKGMFLVAGIFILVGNLCDALDGYLARKYNQQTLMGAFLDSVIDRYSDIIPILSLMYYFKNDDLFFISSSLALIGSYMTSYTRARSESLGVECKVGIMERPERSFVLILSLLTGFLIYGVGIIAFFSNITVIQRVICFYKSGK